MKKVAVVLSGCGYKDGSEITEATSTLVSLAQYGANYQAFSLSESHPSTNHLDDSSQETRNLMIESARIMRGKVSELAELDVNNFDGLALPGGFGAALHFSDWAQKGSQCEVHPQIQKLIEDFAKASKPICAICISPAVVAKVLGDRCAVTIGNDPGTAAEIEKTGAYHQNCEVTDFVSDREGKVISTPAYMYDDASPFEVFTGINRAIKEFVEMA